MLSKKYAVVDRNICVACGACTKECPKAAISVFHGCYAVIDKQVCIGCGKCAKACPFEAITVENNIAYIDYTKCKLCKKCVAECPTGAIHAVNFPVVKPKPEAAPETVKKEE